MSNPQNTDVRDLEVVAGTMTDDVVADITQALTQNEGNFHKFQYKELLIRFTAATLDNPCAQTRDDWRSLMVHESGPIMIQIHRLHILGTVTMWSHLVSRELYVVTMACLGKTYRPLVSEGDVESILNGLVLPRKWELTILKYA